MKNKVLKLYQKTMQVDVNEGIVIFQLSIKLILKRKKLKVNGNYVIHVGETCGENPGYKQISKCTNVLWEDYKSKPKLGKKNYVEKDNKICYIMSREAKKAAYDIILNARKVK